MTSTTTTPLTLPRRASRPTPRPRRAVGVRLGLGVVAGGWWLGGASVGLAQMPTQIPVPSQSPIAVKPATAARQVVVVGVEAIPGSTEMDPKIAPVVQAQLRRLRPGHGFRLIRVKGERVAAGQTVKCDLEGGFAVQAKLANPQDPHGKVQLQFNLTQSGESQFQTMVATPPDQFNFFDKALPDGNRLIVGVGAR